METNVVRLSIIMHINSQISETCMASTAILPLAVESIPLATIGQRECCTFTTDLEFYDRRSSNQLDTGTRPQELKPLVPFEVAAHLKA